MHFVLRSKLCQGFLFFQEFLDYFGLEGRCVLLSHHALVYLIPDPFPVQFLGSIIVEGEPKTKAGRRKILLPRVVVNALKEHKARQDEARAKMGDRWKEHGLIFCNKYGGFFNPDYVWYLFKKMLKEAGLPDVRFHDLRHGAATVLLAAKVDLKVVSELLGHSSVAITADIYAHVLPEMQQEVVKKMDDLYKRP